MSNNESIKDTLDVIRRALEDKEDFTEKNENILILNKKVNDDGTVKLLNQSDDINAINRVIDKKLDDLMENKMTTMLENQLPIILDNYFKHKK
jgi:predicted metal-dependent hydrolase